MVSEPGLTEGKAVWLESRRLSAVGRLTAEYGKIGGNLNQIARALNEYGTPYNALSAGQRP